MLWNKMRTAAVRVCPDKDKIDIMGWVCVEICCRRIHKPSSPMYTYMMEKGKMDWMRPRMWILMSPSGYSYSWAIICSLMCVILTGRIIMPVTHQWRHCWTFAAHNLSLLFTSHTFLQMAGQQNTRGTQTSPGSRRGASDVMDADLHTLHFVVESILTLNTFAREEFSVGVDWRENFHSK